MATFTLKCNKCGKDKTVIQKAGEPVNTQSCSCGGLYKRVFNNIGVGEVVEDKMIDISNLILNGSLPSGKSKVVF
jgi:hypothetical protein